MLALIRPLFARAALCGLAALALGGWTVGPNYRAPPSPLVAATPAPVIAHAGALTWWDGFGDPVLSSLVAEAQARNLDVEQARARVLQSRALARAAGAALLPAAETTAGIGHDSLSLESPVGALVKNLPGFQRQYDQYQLGAQASWEIDLFGGLRREREGAAAQARASEADLAAVQVAVAADAADGYLQVRAFQARLEVTRRQETVQRDLVALVERRAGQGVASERELHEASAALDGVRAGIPPLNAGLETQFARLDVLLGSAPGAARARLAAPGSIPTPPALDDAGGSAGLLRRRPDIVAAEQRLIGANAGIGAALADYYPKVSISGLLGVNSISASQLFTGTALESQIGAGLRWRLFDFGRVDAEVAQARGRYAESLAAWRQTVLRGAGEVETAFSDLAQQRARAAILSGQIDQLTQARRQAQQAYDSGVIGLIEVRDADRDLLTASDALAQTRADEARAAVAAYRALGGDWRG